LLLPLASEQQEAVAALIKASDEVNYDYKFQRSKELWVKASSVWLQASEVAEVLPEGNLKKLVLAVGLAYHDAAVAWCGYTDQLGRFTREDVMRVIERLGMQRSSAPQIVTTTFRVATVFKDALASALAKSPVIRSAQQPSIAPKVASTDTASVAAEVTIDQVEERTEQLSNQLTESTAATGSGDARTPTRGISDWAFPNAGTPGHYSEATKGMIYDLGDGMRAGHMKLDTDHGPVSVVLIIFSAQIPEAEINVSDLALMVVSKVVNLPDKMSDTVLGRNQIGEFRFRTAGGKVVGVNIPPDRKTALIRYIE
jgi:cation diffusion facilitator CzcD-associated flavoprotein CzcO